MSLTITVSASKSAADLPVEVEARARALSGVGLNKAIGRAVAQNIFIPHFVKLDAERTNALGGERTHFYANAAKATSSSGDAEGATVTVSQLGLRQRLEGGEIKPTGGRKYLTIPARAEAYGRRAGEFRNLRFVKLSGDRGMLVEADSQDVSFGRTRRSDGASRTGQTRKVSPGEERGGLVMYWLVPSVVQKKDPSVLPSELVIAGEVVRVVDAAWERAEKRRLNAKG